MDRLQEFTLTVEETLNACEEYIRNVSGILTEKDVRQGCQFIEGKGDPKDPKVRMSFGGKS